MKTKIKKIINLIVLIILVIVAFMFIKALPNILKEENIQDISKVEETVQALTSNESTEEFLRRVIKECEQGRTTSLTYYDSVRMSNVNDGDIIYFISPENGDKLFNSNYSLKELKNWVSNNKSKFFDVNKHIQEWNLIYKLFNCKNDTDAFTQLLEQNINCIKNKHTSSEDFSRLCIEKDNNYYAYSWPSFVDNTDSASKYADNMYETVYKKYDEYLKADNNAGTNTGTGNETGSGSGSGSNSSTSSDTSINQNYSNGAGSSTYYNLNKSNVSAASFAATTSNLHKYSYNDGYYWRVEAPSVATQIYCASKGYSLSGSGVSYEYIQNYINSMIGKNTGWRSSKSHVKYSTYNSYPYYFKTSTRLASYYEAFALTWPGIEDTNWNDWSAYKQEAVWDSPTLSSNKKTPLNTSNGMTAEILAVQAGYYSDFRTKIAANNEKMVKGDKTEQTAVEKHINYTTQEYTVGPFKIDYINGDYNLVFGGISDMYLIGQNTSRIEIESIILVDPTTKEHTEVKTNYFVSQGTSFSGTMAEGQTGVTDRGQNHLLDVYPQYYPDPNQEFYVKYKATTDEQIEKLHIDFKWMKATSTITYYDAMKYKNAFSEKETTKKVKNGTNPNTGRPSYTTKYKCTINKGWITAYNPNYQKLMSAEGKREIISEQLEIVIPKNGINKYNGNSHHSTPPETNRNLQIKLAGHVWEDEKSGKESLANGIKDSNEDMMAGVEVFLHYADGTLVSKDANGDKLINPTVTDNNGYYEFNDLNAQSKYYIEFVYNGQTYQATNYTGINLAGGYSNATEIGNERKDYNNNFKEISSAPENYKVRRSLYYSVGDTNTAYIIGKDSSETPYGIKEIYEYVIERAVANKNYAAAYSDALSKFGNNNSTKSKLQFIEDCRISSYTGYDSARTVYPIYNEFVESTIDKVVNGVTYHALYATGDSHLNIDFGITKRETFDLALRKDVEKATVEINGKTHTYTYDTRSNADETDDGTWDIGVRLSDAYYNTKYSREIFGEDYQYKASNYGDNSEIYGKTKQDELNVYVTYKLTVRNQSQSILGEVMEIVDYYDEDYEYINERSYIEIKNGNNTGIHEINSYNESRYGTSNQTDIAGYDAVYVRGLEGIKLTSGQTAYVYLTFKIKKDNINGEDWIRLDEKLESAEAIGVGKENIAEINGFRTYYKDGTTIPNIGKVSGNSKVAGLFDKDSVPGNLNEKDITKDGNINYENFEDDTDKAPNIRLIIYRENGQIVCRQIDGVVWEDERTEENVNQVTTVGDGIKQDNEKTINGVTVQLVELMDNGTEYIWKQFSSGQNYINQKDVYTPIINIVGESGNTLIPSEEDHTEGKYIFKSYMPGNYVVRFIYGDTVKTVLPNTSTEITNAFGTQGQNSKSYNGQDYKSTTYQEGVVQNKEYIWRIDSTWQNGQEILGQELTRIQTFKADSSNNESANATVDANNQKGYLYDITASDAKQNVSDAKDIMRDNNQNIPNGRQNATLNSREDVIDYSDNDIMNYIAEVLASHEKLPLNSSELGIKLNELMTKTQMTAETGLIDVELEYDRNATGGQIESNSTSYQIHNVSLGLEERPKAQLSTNKEVTNVKVTLADGSTLFDATQKVTNVLWRNHKPYEFKYSDCKLAEDPMVQIRKKNSYDAVYGLIQLSMDEELMHGATIKISYKVTITNVGEVDYKENSFYYTGNVADKNTIVTTTANQLVDYVANNLQFYAVDNEAWQVISQDDLLNGPVNMTLANDTAKYNTVITTSDKSNISKTKLVPTIYGSGTSSVSDDLVLTQLITSENETDDLTYRNIVEIVRTSNDVGRRNAYSIVGNQNPISNITEVDTDVAQIVKILPPFGNGGIYYIIALTILLVSVILITIIVLIKKKAQR